MGSTIILVPNNVRHTPSTIYGILEFMVDFELHDQQLITEKLYSHNVAINRPVFSSVLNCPVRCHRLNFDLFR